MKIGLRDFDGKQVNLALMKLSAYHKAQGDTVVLDKFTPADVDKVYVSVIFKKNREAAMQYASQFSNVEIGGTGYDLTTTLPAHIESLRPDYDLYSMEDIYPRMKGVMTKERKIEKATEIINAGIGFLYRGCIRHCKFCVVPTKEGGLQRVAQVSDLINPKSNIITLLDANLTSEPDAIDTLHEIRDRKLILDITQGIDVRLMTPEIAKALSEVKMLRSLHYAWDLMGFEKQVLTGIDTLATHVKRWRHMCFMLVGFNTTFAEDYYRFHKLAFEAKVDPFVMIYTNGKKADAKLRHFARWVNARVYTKIPFNEYRPWVKAQLA
jgi:hypothetical protein